MSLALDYRVLVYDQPVLIGRVVEIDQPYIIADDRAVAAGILDAYPVAQPLVERAVVADKRRRIGTEDFS